jgi:hypothetical protein
MSEKQKDDSKKKGTPGRKKFVPTDEERRQVELLAGLGIPVAKIALLVRGGIGQSTLYRHFAADMQRGQARADSEIAKTLYQQAMRGNTAALIFWAKARLRWSEKVQ